MTLFIDILSWACILGGSFFMIVSAVGMLRFPEFWSRVHAASVGVSGGMIRVIACRCLQSGLTLITVKLIAIGVFLFITGPTATHAVANAALVTGFRPKSGKGLKPEENAPYADADPSGHDQ